MIKKIMLNELKRNLKTTIILFLFIMLAAMLLSVGSISAVVLKDAISTSMEKADTPHFLQMHSGEVDRERIAAFASNREEVEQFQVMEFLNFDGNSFQFESGTLADSNQDNGLVTQGDGFDFLLDMDGNPIEPQAGELYVPLCYMQSKIAKLGEKAWIDGKEFTIAGFLRDSQMNASMASSKRFLVCMEDFNALREQGKIEYLIEFRLKEDSDIGAFEAAYLQEGLECNGPAVTYPLISMMNAITDGITIAILIVVAVIVILIALLCIRFAVLIKMEREYQEIGVMKAIGMTFSEIRKIYLVQFIGVIIAGGIAGFTISIPLKQPFLANIHLFMGRGDNEWISILFGLIAVLILSIAIITYVFLLLQRFRKISAIRALRNEVGSEKEQSHQVPLFTRISSANVTIGLQDVLTRNKMYLTMMSVVLLATFISIVPRNLYDTISDKNFVTYMGVGICDVRMDIQQTDEVARKCEDISCNLSTNEEVEQFAVFQTKSYTVLMEDGSKENIKIELGNHQSFPVTYLEGCEPTKPDEIALSTLNADEFQTKVGEKLIIEVNGVDEEFTVCGIYSDITNGGKTAKATFEDEDSPAMLSIIYINLVQGQNKADFISKMQQEFPFVKISDIEQYVNSMFGQTVTKVNTLTGCLFVISGGIVFLITAMFINMLVTKDRHSIAVLKSIGYNERDVMNQYLTRSGGVGICGILLGVILANTLGEQVVKLAISAFGASTFHFVMNLPVTVIIYPIVISAIIGIATLFGGKMIRQIKISEWVKE